MRSSFLPESQPKISQISALEVYSRVGQKSEKFLVGILGKMMTSLIHSEFNWPLAVIFQVSISPKIYLFLTKGQTITKSDLIACLSEIARNDVINDKKPRTLSAPCRGQLKFQLLQKHTNINLNPRVVSWNWETTFTVVW